MSSSAVFLSDDLGFLADCLAQNLFLPGSKPFDKRLVIVPSQATKIFLQRKWARSGRVGIAAGVEIVEMPVALSMLASRIGKALPSSLELALRLFPIVFDSHDEGLRRYLEGKNDRLFPLCQKLARLFLEYGQCSEENLELWLKKDGWQARLWKAVFETGNLTYPTELFKSRAVFDACPHLFGFMSLPTAFAQFFKRCDAKFYLFSPCSQFWGDFISDKTHAKESLRFQKRGIAEKELAEFDRYVGEQHPLLANWGQAGRHLLEVLQAEEMPGDEHYFEKEPRSRLHLVQKSILHLDGNTCIAADRDDSIQILSVSGRAREMETLLDCIKAFLLKHTEENEPLLPGDILVLAPDISQYVPYIQAYFGSEEGGISFSISGIERVRTSPLAEAFRNLIGLLDKRFDAQALITLFQSVPFRDKQGWEESDLAQIASWIEKAGITWGYDGVQRAKIAHAQNPLEDRGSFSFGIDRILFGLACRQTAGEAALPSPLPILEWTEADLFGKFAQVVEDLQADVAVLIGQEKWPLAEWAAWSGRLFDRYLASEEENWLYVTLLRLAKLYPDAPLLDFPIFCRIVDDIINRRNGHTPNSDMQAVRFASLAEGEVLPARMICLLGMHEGAYPRVESLSSLEEVPSFSPNASACDRYLFLEALLKARDYLWISYLSHSSEDKVEMMPSVVVQELIDWLKKFYQESDAFVATVPSLAISKEALELFPYFSSARYQAARLYYGNQPLPPPAQLPLTLPPDVWPEDEEIKIEDLYECLRNSVGFYFSQVLHVRLKKEEEEDFDQEEFCLPVWQERILASQCLTSSIGDVVAKAKQRGEFPMGEFEKVAIARLEERVQGLREKLDLFGVAPEECTTVILSRCCEKAVRLENGSLLLPAWEVALENGRTYFVTGQIESVSPKGLACPATDKAPELFPFWPHYIVLAGHPALHDIPSALLPLCKLNRKGDPLIWPGLDPKEELAKLILYCQKAKTLISPLISKWIFECLDGPFEKWEKKVGDSRDLNVVWLLKQQGAAFTKALFELWQPYWQGTFQNFMAKFEKKEESADV